MFSHFAHHFQMPSVMKSEVAYALQESKDRCLSNNTKMLAEILIALKDVPSLFSKKKLKNGESGFFELEQQFTSIEDYLTHCRARTYFEIEEYQMCAHVTKNSNDSKCMFLHYMARFRIMHNKSICERPNLFDSYQPLDIGKFMELLNELLILNVYGSEDDSEEESDEESQFLHEISELDNFIQEEEEDCTPMRRRCGRRQRSQKIEKASSTPKGKKNNKGNKRNNVGKKNKISSGTAQSETSASSDHQALRIKREDPYLLWLTAIMLKKVERFEEAFELLIKAIQIQPCFWNAWVDLSALIKDIEMFESVTLLLGEITDYHWIQLIFTAQVYIDFQITDGAVRIYHDILEYAHPAFKQWSYLYSQLAISHHNKRQITNSVMAFTNVLKTDPYRLDNFDLLSNLMYVCDHHDEIMLLSKHTASIDRFRQETLCVIGNMYSLKCDHAKSVLYFKKVVRMNPHNVTAWTLLGHEYIEMKNSSAAIISYRQALKINIKDYRAWYGLGQIYELVKLPKYALFYFGHSRALRPGDSRMLLALGEMFDRDEHFFEALACFYKALPYDNDGTTLLKLGKFYDRYGNNCSQTVRENFTTLNFNAVKTAFKHKSDEEITLMLGKIFLYLGHHYMDLNHFDRAMNMSEKCRSLCCMTDDYAWLTSHLLHYVTDLLIEIEYRVTVIGTSSATAGAALRARRFLFTL